MDRDKNVDVNIIVAILLYNFKRTKDIELVSVITVDIKPRVLTD